jgi:hypothetical protein
VGGRRLIPEDYVAVVDAVLQSLGRVQARVDDAGDSK